MPDYEQTVDDSQDVEVEDTATDDEVNDLTEIPLYFSEFQEFLVALKQYYVYCKVVKSKYTTNNDNLLCRSLIILRLMKVPLCPWKGSLIQKP